MRGNDETKEERLATSSDRPPGTGKSARSGALPRRSPEPFALEPGDHVCCVYSTDEELLILFEGLVGHCSNSGLKPLFLSAGEPSDVTPAAPGRIVTALQADGILESIDVVNVPEECVANGALHVDGMKDFVRGEAAAAKEGRFSGLMLIQDTTALASQLGSFQSLQEYEVEGNRFIPGSTTIVVCLYDRRRFDPGLLISAMEAHPLCIIDGRLCTNIYYLPPRAFQGKERKAEELEARIDNIREWKCSDKGSGRQPEEPSREDENLRQAIAERDRARVALQAAKERYRNVVENCTEGICIIQDQRAKFVNKALLDSLEYPFEELTSRPFFDFIHPDEREWVMENHRRRVEGEPHVNRYVVRMVSKSGKTHCFQNQPVTIEWEGRPAFLVFTTDVTELKLAEEALQTKEAQHRFLLDNMHDILWTVDLHMNTTYVSPSVRNILGFTTQERMHQSVWEQLTPESLELAQETLMNFLTFDSREGLGDDTPVKLELDFYRKDGSVVCLETLMGFLRDDKCKPVGVYGLSRDITERKEFEDALKQAKEAAESATRARTDFLANISHEIRTPVHAVLGTTELLLEAELTSSQRARVNMIKFAANALLSLLNDILDFSKIEAGKLDLDEVSFGLRESLAGPVSLMTMRVRDKNLDLQYHVEDDVPDDLLGDPNRLRQVLMNLSDNAIKFTNEGIVRITVEVEQRLTDGVVLHFAVADTGIGIDHDKQQAIFERFVQADSSTSRAHGGVGLGLAISSELAKALGGKMWVESEPGRGSTFHFTARFGTGDSDKGSEPRASQEFPNPSHVQGTRVLLAEDNMYNQAIAVEVLKKLGCEVVVASDGREAVEAFEDGEFDVILMDLQMPGMDGFEAARLIRKLETGKRVPIIAQTAHASKDDRDRCLEAGMDCLISKPVTRAELVPVLQKLRSPDESKTCSEPLELGMSAETGTMVSDEPLRIDGLMESLEGDEEAVQEIIDLFFTQMPGMLNEIRAAVRDRNLEKAGRLSHSFAGACANLGAFRLRHASIALEEAAKCGDEEVVRKLDTEIDRESEALRQAAIRMGLI